MRRKDREVTDIEKIKEVINKCRCCRIGFNDNGKIYIVPLNFGYEEKENAHILYFHGASEGRKIDLIKNNPDVGFEMDTDYKLKEAEIACSHSASYKSIIGNGKISLLSDVDEKRHGLSVIMEHITEKYDWAFNEKMINAAAVFKLEVTEMSCKEHQ